MGGGTMVGNPCDELTGNKVGITGGGTMADDMYEDGHKIGIRWVEQNLRRITQLLRQQICWSRQATTYTSSFSRR